MIGVMSHCCFAVELVTLCLAAKLSTFRRSFMASVQCLIGKCVNCGHSVVSRCWFQILHEKWRFRKNPHNYAMKKTLLMKQKV